MDTQTSDKPATIDVAPGEFPFYTQPEETKKDEPISLATIPQGNGSNLGADTVDGLNAVNASAAGPNLLVATDATGKLPSGIIPSVTQTVTLVQKQSPSAVSSITFSSLTPGVIYKIYFNFNTSAAGNFTAQVNGDSTAAKHKWGVLYSTDSSNTTARGSTSTTSWNLNQSFDNTGAGNVLMGDLQFCSDPSSSSLTYGRYNVTYYSTSSALTQVSGGGQYNNTALSSIVLAMSAGTFTGTAYLVSLNP